MDTIKKNRDDMNNASNRKAGYKKCHCQTFNTNEYMWHLVQSLDQRLTKILRA